MSETSHHANTAVCWEMSWFRKHRNSILVTNSLIHVLVRTIYMDVVMQCARPFSRNMWHHVHTLCTFSIWISDCPIMVSRTRYRREALAYCPHWISCRDVVNTSWPLETIIQPTSSRLTHACHGVCIQQKSIPAWSAHRRESTTCAMSHRSSKVLLFQVRWLPAGSVVC